MKVIALLALVCLLQLATPKQVFVTYSKESESKQLYKYFCDLHNEYFVDIGAYDPVTNSNTLGLSTWRGLNIEASQSRAKSFLYGRPHQMSYNLAITNVTGGLKKLNEVAEDTESSLTKTELNGKQVLFEEDSISLSLPDLCTRYYLRKPKILLISNSLAFDALTSNDWNNDMCVPESILTDSDSNIESFLLSKNYTKMNMIGKKTFYIHNKVLNQFTAKYAVCSQKYNQFREIDRKTLFTKLHKAINSSVSENLGDVKHINYQSVALYPYFVHQKLVSIEAIYRFMNAFSEIKNRPLLIMSYYPQYSKIFLNSKKFTLEKVVIGDEKFSKLVIQYPNALTLTVYIYDHQVGGPIILDDDSSLPITTEQCEKKNIAIEKIVYVDPPKRLLETTIETIENLSNQDSSLFILGGASVCFVLAGFAVILSKRIKKMEEILKMHEK